MSKIYVAEYADLANTGQGAPVACVPLPPLVEYTVIVSAASSGAAQPFQPATRWIEVSTDTTCSIVVGLFPGVIGTGVAGLSNQRLQSNDRVLRRVPSPNASQYPGNGYSAAPTLYGIFTTANV